MEIAIHSAGADDAVECGRICYADFAAIAIHHRFPVDFPSAEVGAGLIGVVMTHLGFYGGLAESEGQPIVGKSLAQASNAN